MAGPSIVAEQQLDPVEVALAEFARRAREAAESGQWLDLTLTIRAGRPEKIHSNESVRVADLAA